MEKKSTKQQMTGVVVSNKMDKTVVVKVDVRMRHPKYHKSYTKSLKYKAHDEGNTAHMGDRVVIESCAPISKDKSFTIVKNMTPHEDTPVEAAA
ncbi:MAG TPA: 30S ribosomal protein S17 [Patescibacteria group bacterium]|jgi:small subunit ribosomal protein S17|nr:30S ribosomal protein S17 [Patescibacteria group bacterium]